MSELSKATSRQSARSKPAVNWPVMGITAAAVAYIVWVWVNDYRVNHAPTNQPTVSTTK